MINIRYLDFHFPKPYRDESGPGWGLGEGTVSGERLSGTMTSSNHPSLRSDGVALPDFRGVITTAVTLPANPRAGSLPIVSPAVMTRQHPAARGRLAGHSAPSPIQSSPACCGRQPGSGSGLSCSTSQSPSSPGQRTDTYDAARGLFSFSIIEGFE